jgi:transglutaminase-like putative cysteine protease
VASEAVQRAFLEWTKGLSDRNARVNIFNQIRDIPYAVVPEINNPVDGPEGLLKCMRGSCGPKHFLLGRMFKMLRVPVQYVTYPFSWNVKSVAYPPELRKLTETVPIGHHLACEARIENEWVIVDATWDRPLARVGFPVNENWNGVSGTKLAVEPLGGVVHENPKGRVSFAQTPKSSWTANDHARTDYFASVLSNWLEDVRRNSSS